jgi:signal transduction histidine kinase
MRGPSSLSNRIFLACTLLAALPLGFAFYFVNALASAEAEAELRRGLTDAASLVDERRTTLSDTYTRLAKLVADLPKLKAAVDLGDPPTVQPIAEDFRTQVRADVLVVSDRSGRVLGAAGDDARSLPIDLARASSAEEISEFLPHSRGMLQIVTVPIFLMEPPEVLGRLTIGFFLDDELASQFKRLTGSDIAFAANGRILASSIPANARAPLETLIEMRDIASVELGDDEFMVLARPIASAAGAPRDPAQGGPVVLTLRSRTERLRFLTTIRAGLVAALVVTVLLATILSFAVARTMTRPLAAVSSAMREVAATGDLTRRVAVQSQPWDDEDARLLGTAFNTLTESLARSQREAAQKERLTALGRLSTVIAHEIRNPLMIIRATLSTLRRDRVTPTEVREAVADIDEETRRLNRVVSDVLDFARPIRIEMSEANINDVCRASVIAAWAGEPDSVVAYDFDPALPPVVTDAERLRTALVNVLTNARHALVEAPAGHSDGARAAGHARIAVASRPGIVVRTRLVGYQAVVTIEDHGVGIAEEHMAHIFDPYFTTRRAGTGLGLPITKNIVERLGGTISLRSTPGKGTEIRIALPLAASESTA